MPDMWVFCTWAACRNNPTVHEVTQHSAIVWVVLACSASAWCTHFLIMFKTKFLKIMYTEWLFSGLSHIVQAWREHAGKQGVQGFVIHDSNVAGGVLIFWILQELRTKQEDICRKQYVIYLEIEALAPEVEPLDFASQVWVWMNDCISLSPRSDWCWLKY